MNKEEEEMVEQAKLLDLLETEYQTTLEIIEICDLEIVAQPDSG